VNSLDVVEVKVVYVGARLYCVGIIVWIVIVRPAKEF
jgi:hypothetical protein